jgi:hypothetical protein
VRRPRELLAAAVVLVGSTLWLVVPDMQGGSLRDDSAIARWKLRPPGTALAAWVMVDNAGPRTITLTGATIEGGLPEGVELLGVRARIGKVVTFGQAFPGPPGPFRRIEGFRVPPNRGATVGFGLALERPGVVALEDVRVTYREGGDEHELRARRTARVCVAVRPRGC